MSDRPDLYEVLDVAPTASADDIRAAYYRQVRKHPPEKDAEGFQQVQQAYEVLGDPTTRREYDDQRRSDPETQRLVAEGRELLDAGDPEALTPLKRALVRQPDSLVVRDLLVQALILAESFDDAEKHARRLTAQAPENPVYQIRLGDVYRAADRDGEAEAPFRRAVALDQDTHQPVLRLAFLLTYLDRKAEAVALLEQAIIRDGRVDFDDFLFFRALCEIYVATGDLGKISGVRQRIRQVLPPDPETRSYVAWFYYRFALMLAHAKNFDAAVLMIEEAAGSDDSLPELHAAKIRIAGSKAALDDIQILRKDENVLIDLRFLLGTLVLMRVLDLSDEYEETFNSAGEAVSRHFSLDRSPLGISIAYVRRVYPAIAAVTGDLLGELENKLQATPKSHIFLKCPSCGDEGIADGPIDGRRRIGSPRTGLVAAAERQAWDEVLPTLRFTCKSCGTHFNGLSDRIRGGRTPMGGSSIWARDMGETGCAVVAAVLSITVVVTLFSVSFFGGVEIFSSAPPTKSHADSQIRPADVGTQADPAGASLQSPAQEGTAPPSTWEAHVMSESLNLRDHPSTEGRIVDRLERFESVTIVEGVESVWAYVRTQDGKYGYAAGRFLNLGSGDEARARWCRDNAGPRPRSGQVLQQIARGPHKLTIHNDPGRDAVVKLKTWQDKTVVSVYVRAGETAVVSSIPEGAFKTLAAYGSTYSAVCGYFLDNLQVQRLDDNVLFKTTMDANYRYTTTLEYTLYQVENGNLSPKKSSLEEFLD